MSNYVNFHTLEKVTSRSKLRHKAKFSFKTQICSSQGKIYAHAKNQPWSSILVLQLILTKVINSHNYPCLTNES